MFQVRHYGGKHLAHCLSCGANWLSNTTGPFTAPNAFYDRLIRNALEREWCTQAQAEDALVSVCGHSLAGKLTRWRSTGTHEQQIHELDLGETHLKLISPDWKTADRTFQLELTGAVQGTAAFPALDITSAMEHAQPLAEQG